MKKLRMLFIALISVFALFFNVERLDIGNVTIVNIETYVYALGIIICIAVVGLPKLWLRSVYLPIGVTLVAYLALKLVMIHERPLFGGIYTYLTITESSSLVLIAWLSYQLISPLLQFEETVKTYTYDIVATKIPDPQKSKKIIRTEITRSRHYKRPMSILTIKTRPHAALKLNQIVIQDIQNKMAHHYTKNKMAQTIKQVLRRMDVVLDTQQENSLLILCPEVDEPGAITLMSHVQNELEKKLGIQVMCSSATFPSDGITFSALLDSANQKFKGEQADETESLAKQPAKSYLEVGR